MSEADPVLAATRLWVQRFVVGLNLCPFARRELDAGRVRFMVSDASDLTAVLQDLEDALHHLASHTDTETTLLVLPAVLQDFEDYLDALDLAERLLDLGGWRGSIQLASFHPQYCFEGVAEDAPENFSNRSPWPMFHLLREASLERAIAAHGEPERIPRDNVNRLNYLGADGIAALYDGIVSSHEAPC